MCHSLMPNLMKYSHFFPKLQDGKPIWRIGIYVRLSKEDKKSQQENSSISIINQIKIQALKLSKLTDYVIYDIYIDDGITGTDFHRKDYMRLHDDIIKKTVNCYCVKDITRFVRNFAIGIQQLESYVLEQNVRFISFSYPEVDTYLDPKSISRPAVYEALQQAEALAMMTSIKVREAQEMKRMLGESTGGFPAYGWLPNSDGKQWQYDPHAGPIREQIFLWTKEGFSPLQISRKLNALGVPNPVKYKESLHIGYKHPHSGDNSGLWAEKTVREILRDKKNIGSMVQGKTSCFDHKRHKQIPQKKEDYIIVPNSLPRIIPDELYYEVQEILDLNSRITKSGKVHIFSNLVYCSTCHKAMKKNSSKGYSYLVCRTHKDTGREGCGLSRSISFELLEETVLKIIQMQIGLIADLKTMLEKIYSQPMENNPSIDIGDNMKQVEKEIAELELILDYCYHDWKNGDISNDQYQRIRITSERKIQQCKKTMDSLTIEQEKLSEKFKTDEKYFGIYLKYQNINSLDRPMLLELVKRIYVYEDKSLRVEFNYCNPYLLLLERFHL